MHLIKGLVIYQGLMIGRARKLEPVSWDLPATHISPSSITAEIKSLEDAIHSLAKTIELQFNELKGSEEEKAILSSHLLILKDPELISQVKDSISKNLVPAAVAIQQVFSQVQEHFKNLSNDFLAQREADYRDVEQRLLLELTGKQQEVLHNWAADQIAILKEATPSWVSAFAYYKVPAYCSEQGSLTSHASILSRALKIISITDLAELWEKVSENEKIILDALNGKVIIDPDISTLQYYEKLNANYHKPEEPVIMEKDSPIKTKDGHRIILRCNLDPLSDLNEPTKLNADGVGLYRTEFLYLGKDELPSEDYQFSIYKQVAELIAPHSVVIRTFDLGGDKLSHLIPSAPEDNPYLGNRGIRFSLSHKDVFKTQIRAVLRAAIYGKVKLMFPMVKDYQDYLQAKEIVEECKTELQKENIPFAQNLPLGVMIEIPSAALCAEELAENCDFMSIGTNDLVQYTLAADRNNSALSDYYITHHPAVLKLMMLTLQAGNKYEKPVSICGEMASQPQYVPLLIGMGFKELSVGTSAFLRCKKIIRHCDKELFNLIENTDLGHLDSIENLIFEQLKPYYKF
ncbi:phosphoenolpyruvate--protein phosphotransferase [Candidatus Syntrophosphaera thermopropionivorans]|uniref:Phosphoenolpyruvate--protein phosphotransferase n=1 Tax=Candidatus Syntrophosphaera thermopropionivorans TaxID=2593015 RepID=A0AC61QKP3_9BACT|nr:phosphoenolpyruvate--protein phosphotransferase [Candidatus Syntrophosphaera thermopropionivorans]TDF74232.1 phosphoenolpyruvate--protein phosphotransferase [Candidatus Syntrophosphaera thermopropionivorans]